ncbi:MAG: MarR family transcriptional regulator [Alphaproteobacteria bacterium]|nr:MarR family transcriptional regulator [Alphaproteobacteria bacterium]
MRSIKKRHSPAGEAMFDLIVETAATFFRIRAAGQRLGAVNAWGGGTWGLMRGLAVGGPQTVPQIARARPVARQRIQKMVNELAEAGLVEFVDNPGHKRSKLVSLTAKGSAKYGEITERILDLADAMARDMSERDLKSAVAVLRRLRGKLERNR